MNISYQREKKGESAWERYVRGDKGAFGELYAYYHKSLTAFCLGRLKNFELAENAASETLVKLLQYEEPEKIDNFENFLFTVARNVCNTTWTKNVRRNRLIEKELEASPRVQAPDAEQRFATENIDKLIRENLTEKDYSIWQLHQQGYDNAEIAEILTMTEKTVANRKSETRKKLKQLFKSYNAQ